MFVVSSNNRNRYRGIYEWITSIGMITLSTTLITLRGEISNVFSVFISNVLVFLAFMLFLKGFARFMHIKQHLVAHMSVATVLAFCFAYFTFVNEFRCKKFYCWYRWRIHVWLHAHKYVQTCTSLLFKNDEAFRSHILDIYYYKFD